MTVPPPDPTYPPPWDVPPAGMAWPTPFHPPQRPSTNGFAVAALITGILGFLGGWILGLIFGFVALSQIRSRRQGGRGLAIAGLVLSGAWIVVFVVVVVVVLATRADRDNAGQITAGGSVSATALREGDCVNDLKDTTSLLSLPAVPCNQAHEGEVFAVFDLPAGPYPGQSGVDDAVNTECSGRLAGYSTTAAADPGVGLFSVYPLEQNWKAGDRQVVCIAAPFSGTASGSIKDG